MTSQNVSFSHRRDFLKKAASTAAVIAPGVTLMNIGHAYSDKPVTNEVRWGMLVDTTKCADGCTDCVSACETENGWGKGSSDETHSNAEQKAQWIRKLTVRNTTTDHTVELPMMCQHCENPPCVDVCPTQASHKREDGIVLVDKHRCIGCRYCMMACPYKARSFIHEALFDQKAHAPRGKGTVESCNMCVHKVDNGEQPACVSSCKSGAMMFGDLNDKNSNIAKTLKELGATQIRADLGLNPGVMYRGV